MKPKTSHYFTNDPQTVHDIRTIEYAYRDRRFVFRTDAGVFSKDGVDRASDLLIRQVPEVSGSLLDLGCGYGCIGIVLGKCCHVEVTLADVNERALGLARYNAEQNGVPVTVVASDGFARIDRFFDTVVTNPPIRAGKDVVFSFYEGAYAHLNDNGRLFVVIQDKHGAQSSIRKLRELFSNCEDVYKKKGYHVLQCVKRSD